MSFPKGDSTLYRQNHMDFDCGNIFCNPSNDWDTWHTNTGNVEYILFWDNQHGRKPSCNPDFIQDRSTVFFSNTLPQVAYASRLSVPQVDTRHQLHVPLEQRVRQLCFCKGKGGQSKMEFWYVCFKHAFGHIVHVFCFNIDYGHAFLTCILFQDEF